VENGGGKMVDVCSNLLNRIIHKQQELLELGSLYELTDKRVIKCSQELDVLINLIQLEKEFVNDDKVIKENNEWVCFK
jgi:hypothetical protein